jgi:hypothetical protein
MPSLTADQTRCLLEYLDSIGPETFEEVADVYPALFSPFRQVTRDGNRWTVMSSADSVQFEFGGEALEPTGMPTQAWCAALIAAVDRETRASAHRMSGAE